ncbi:MAG TPA: amidohydrolase [Gammaproteobacteria bacterium]|nr:amidohydrolase [Gammaproteobacteria bacterium]
MMFQCHPRNLLPSEYPGCWKKSPCAACKSSQPTAMPRSPNSCICYRETGAQNFPVPPKFQPLNKRRVMRKQLYPIALVLALLLASCGTETESETATAGPPSADIIFVGDHIITMDGSVVSAVAVIGERIAATGEATELMALQGESTRIIELGDRALLPGFIDAHGHFSAVSLYADLLNLSSPPVGGVSNVDDIVELIRLRIEQRQIPPGDLVYGFGYDDSLLAEQRHPTRDDLDRASTNHPIVIRHVSGHLLVANSMALVNAGVTSATENPSGGIIRRRQGGSEPDGVMEETALRLFPSSSTGISEARLRQLRRDALSLYAGYGITTIQDANVGLSYVEMLKAEAVEDPFAIDIVAYILGNPLDDVTLAAVTHDEEYVRGFRVGGVKFTLDGSPQGRTAWMSKPYDQGPPGADAAYVAYPSYAPQSYRDRIAGLLERGVPVLAHANGDAAIELMIDGIAVALEGKPIPDHRATIIHAQLIRPDQLDRVKALGIIPSYYSVHPYFWGDWHRLSFGEERAGFISPLRATIDRGIPYTVHNDSPIVPPDMMRLVAITVNRLTRSGFVLGPDQRVSVMEALYAVTLGAAYQYFEEDEKGSLTVGKRADLVILAENPLLVDPLQLENIAIVETFSRGESIYLQ